MRRHVETPPTPITMRLGLLVLGAAALLSDTAHARRVVPFNLLRASRRTRGADAGPLDALPRSGPASPPINITDTAKHLSVQELLVIERLFVLLQRVSAGALVALGAAASRLLNYPPRVVTVHLRGVIASDEEMRAEMRADSEAPAMAHADGLGRFAPFDARAGDLINLQRFDRALNKAFATPGARAVVLVIDSPGGSPAQSSLLYRRLRMMRKRHPKLPLLAFVEDSACSGGYYIACAADEIIVDPNSLVGSIGVIARGFGYVKKLKKDGLERRVQTSGTAKGGLDPFLPMRKGDLRQQRRLLTELHTNFVAAVKEARAGRLQPELAAAMHYNTTRDEGCFASLLGSVPSARKVRSLVESGAGLFDGSVYSGATAVDVGLADAVGEYRTELQRRFGRYVAITKIEPDPPIDYSRLLRWLF